MKGKRAEVYCSVRIVLRDGRAFSFNAVSPGMILDMRRGDRVERYALFGLDELGRLVYHVLEE